MGQTILYNDLTVTGDLTVSGTTTTINTSDLIVEDKNIILGNVVSPTNITADGGGITLKAASDKTFNWISATDRWTSSVGVQATSFTATNGTAVQFLKANGSTQEFKSGKTILVDSTTGIGTDTRTGINTYDQSMPFLSISDAVSASTEGDLIYVRSGNYTIGTQISLNSKANIFCEPGVVITCSNNVVAFALSAGQNKSVTGYADFVCSGAGGVFSQSAGTIANQKVFFQCNSIKHTSAIGGGNIFSMSTGELNIVCNYVDCQKSTIIANSGTACNCYYSSTTTDCLQLLNITASNNSSYINIKATQVDIRGSEGISIEGGNVCLNISDKIQSKTLTSKLLVLKFADADSTANSVTVYGGSYISQSEACINYNASSSTNKTIKLCNDVYLKTTNTNSIFSANSKNILVSSAHSNAGVNQNVNLVGGTFIVDSNF